MDDGAVCEICGIELIGVWEQTYKICTDCADAIQDEQDCEYNFEEND